MFKINIQYLNYYQVILFNYKRFKRSFDGRWATGKPERL